MTKVQMKTEIIPRTVDSPEIMEGLGSRQTQEQRPYTS